MKKKLIYLIVSFSFLTVKSNSQSYFELSVDNDLYFLTDQYYSSGIIISYGKKNENKANHWRLGQEIYHPSHRYTTNLLKIDYPYSGWLYIQNEKEYFIDPSSSFSWGLEIGITGDASLARTFQNFYHRTFLNLEELTWTAAQPQRFHFGFFGQFNKGISISDKIHFTSQFISKLSSYRIQSIGRVGVLIGTAKMNPFQRVSFNKELSKGLYIGTRQEYRPHDFALSGSIFDNSSSKLTKPNLKYRNSFEFGVFTQKKRWTLLMLYQSMSKDTPGQRFSRHKVLNITIRNQF